MSMFSRWCLSVDCAGPPERFTLWAWTRMVRARPRSRSRRRGDTMSMLRNIRYLVTKNHLATPIYLIMYVTSRCNARCKTCFLSSSLNANTDLTTEQIEKVASSMGKLVWLAIGGGEPFLRADLPHICRVFVRETGVENISIPTNGLLPEKTASMVADIAGSVPGSVVVTISLDGFREFHDTIRGVQGCFDKALRTAALVGELKKRYANVSLKVCTVVFNQNYRDVRRLAAFVRANMPVDFHNFEMIRGEPADPDLQPPPADALDAVAKDILDVYRTYHFSSTYSAIESRLAVGLKKYVLSNTVRVLKGQHSSLSCLAGRVHAVVYPDGQVALCELKDPIAKLSAYNYNFRALWGSDHVRDAVRKTGHGCACTHSSFQVTNAFFSPRAFPQILASSIRA
ncbi:MAG: radical SAM protein [Chitinivibrionales bacterium]|nr:radical SAM protein [Chitinivibrionales bacterium]MBD3394298.1 radical SAM protein [Chitinivibrionales bacterium]